MTLQTLSRIVLPIPTPLFGRDEAVVNETCPKVDPTALLLTGSGTVFRNSGGGTSTGGRHHNIDHDQRKYQDIEVKIRAKRLEMKSDLLGRQPK